MLGVLTTWRVSLLLLWAAAIPLLSAQTIEVPSLSGRLAGITPLPPPPDIWVTVTSTVSELIYPQDHVVTRNATWTLWPGTTTTTTTWGCTKYFWFAYPQSEASTYFSTVRVTKTSTVTCAARSGFTTETYLTRTRTAARPSASTIYSCNRTLVYVDINTAGPTTTTLTETMFHRSFTDLTTVCHYTTTSYTPRITRRTTSVPRDTRVWTTPISTEIRDNTPTSYMWVTVQGSETKTVVQTRCLNPTTTLTVGTATRVTTIYTATVDRYWDEAYCSFISSSRSSEEADLLPEATATAMARITASVHHHHPVAESASAPTPGRPRAVAPPPRYAVPVPAPRPGSASPTGDVVEMVRQQPSGSGLPPGGGAQSTGMETFTVTLSRISTTRTVYITAETPSTRYVQECSPSRSLVAQASGTLLSGS